MARHIHQYLLMKGHHVRLILLIWVMCCGIPGNWAHAQNDSLVNQIYAVLILDSLTITADQFGPDIKSMIDQTVNDTTFYRAFQRLRRAEYRFTSELYFYRPDWVPYTYMRSIREQRIVDGHRSQTIIEEYKHPDLVNRRGEYKFYTAKMYDRIFFTHEPVPIPDRWATSLSGEKEPDSRIQKYIRDLKLLMFAPGTRIDLPLMGDKTAIFSEENMKKYDFSIARNTSDLGESVYEFKISVKPDYATNETVIKEFVTVFDALTHQILHRTYRLENHTVLYSFDVFMRIEVRPYEIGYLPGEISYEGWWNMPFRKPEWCRFTFRKLEIQLDD